MKPGIIKKFREEKRSVHPLAAVVILGAPYAVVTLLLVLTHSFPVFFFDVYTFSKEYYAAFTTYTSNPIEWLIQPLQAIARVALDGVRYFYNPLHALNTLVPLVLLLALVTIRKTAPRRFVLPLVVGALLIAPKPDFTFFLWFPNVSALHGAALYFVIALLCGLLFQAMSETKFFCGKPSVVSYLFCMDFLCCYSYHFA